MVYLPLMVNILKYKYLIFRGDSMNEQELLLSRAYELLSEWSEEGESEETLEQLYRTVEELKRIGYKFN